MAILSLAYVGNNYASCASCTNNEGPLETWESFIRGNPDDNYECPSWLISLNLGLFWENAGQTQTFYLAPRVRKTYTHNGKVNTVGYGEIFFAWNQPVSDLFQIQFGLALAVGGLAKVSGDIWDDAFPQFNNYTYSYNVTHSHVAIKSKLSPNLGFYLSPWISGSIGVAFNQSHGFTNTPKIFEAVVNPNFAAKNTTSFTYSIGIGLQRQISDVLQVGLGYEFASWGKSELGRATGQTLNSGPSLGSLCVNGVVLNLDYFL